MTIRSDDDLLLPETAWQRRTRRITNVGLVAVAGTLAWVAFNPGEPAPPPEVATPLYWVPVSPIRDAGTLAWTMAAAFGTVLACNLDVAYPVLRWAARKFKRPELAGEHGWLQGIVAPALRQSTLQAAALITGVVGVAFWHLGLDAIAGFHAALLAGWSVAITAAGMVLAFDIRRGFRLGLSMTSVLLAYHAAVGVAVWTLATVQSAQ